MKRILQRSAAWTRAVPQLAERTSTEATQAAMTPLALHYTANVVQRAPAFDAPEQGVIQRVSRKRSTPEPSYSEDEELEDVELDEEVEVTTGHEYLGLASWNVQHFSNHDVEAVAKELEKQLGSFNVEAWEELFKQFSAFKDKLKVALDDKYDAGTFKRLQNVAGRRTALKECLKKYENFLDEFDINEFAAQIVTLQDEDWADELDESDRSRDRRLALLELVDGFKQVAVWIDAASAGLRIMADILNDQIFIRRMDVDLANSAAELLLELRNVSGSIANKTTLESFRKALHSHNIVIHVEEMFAKNKDWLDVMVLQEINDPELFEQDDSSYTVHRGPHMKSSGESGQNEYYPLLVRKNAGVKVETSYLVTTAGEMKKVSDDEPYQWQKRNSVYRPIMAYLVSKQTPSGKQQYMVGVVHTTPEVDGGLAEFNRRVIYEEVEEGLATLRQWTEERGLPLIVGGDYYLSAEAVVKDPTEKDMRALDDFYDEDEVNEGYDANHYLDEDDLEGLRKAGDSIDEVIGMLNAIKPKSTEEKALVDERLKFLRAAKNNAQIIRNVRRLTVAAQVERLGLYLGQAISGTNPKANPLARWFDLQIADFFIHNDTITDFRVGVMRPEGGMVPLDREDLHYSRYWQRFSDHFPVGGLYGVGEQGVPAHLGRQGQYSQKAVELARVSNLRRFARLALIDKEKKPDLSALSEERIKALALEELRVRIQMIAPRIKIPGDVEECIALIQWLEEKYSQVISEDERIFVTEPGDFEPDYGASETESSTALPSIKRQRTGKEKSARSETADLDVWSLAQPPASANRVAQDQLHAFLNAIAPGWNQAFQNVPGNGAQQGLNQGYMAHQIARMHQAIALPVALSEQAERRRMEEHGLRVLRNGGRNARCFVYAVLMGLTGQTEEAVTPMVNYVARRAGALGGWINADGDVAANVIAEIENIYGVQLDVVVVQHGQDGAIISGRGGQLGQRTVVIRQTPGHYDAYVP